MDCRAFRVKQGIQLLFGVGFPLSQSYNIKLKNYSESSHFKQLLNEVFAISGRIKVEVGVIRLKKYFAGFSPCSNHLALDLNMPSFPFESYRSFNFS